MVRSRPRFASVIIVLIVMTVAACTTSQPEYPPSHIARLSGTTIDLDDYGLTETRTVRDDEWFTYTLRPSVTGGTSPSEFVEATPEIWQTMPEISTLVASYGLPPEFLLVESDAGVWLNFFYGSGQLFFGTTSRSVLEIRFSDDFEYEGYVHSGVGVGSPIADVIDIMGAPVETVYGNIEWEDQTLYVHESGGYIMYGPQGVRFFLRGEDESALVVNAMFLFAPQ